MTERYRANKGSAPVPLGPVGGAAKLVQKYIYGLSRQLGVGEIRQLIASDVRPVKHHQAAVCCTLIVYDVS